MNRLYHEKRAFATNKLEIFTKVITNFRGFCFRLLIKHMISDHVAVDRPVITAEIQIGHRNISI